ncbi:hypothetical protein I5S59_02985 [Pseudomonas alkylphenolica]|nr:hypothetical protein [Pseudomonas alkylphenolica]
MGRFHEVLALFARRLWHREILLVVLRQEQPQVTGALDLETFLRLRHLWVHRCQTRGMVDQWLGEQSFIYILMIGLITGKGFEHADPRRRNVHLGSDNKISIQH